MGQIKDPGLFPKAMGLGLIESSAHGPGVNFPKPCAQGTELPWARGSVHQYMGLRAHGPIPPTMAQSPIPPNLWV